MEPTGSYLKTITIVIANIWVCRVCGMHVVFKLNYITSSLESINSLASYGTDSYFKYSYSS